MPITEKRGFPIYYEKHGDGAATPLLMIMGLGGTCQGWNVVTVPELSKERPCVILDNRGAGRSGDPGGEFSTADLAEDALSVLDELGIAKAHVMGGFLGGMVAQELAIAHPDRVDHLILIGTFARPDARRRAILDLWKSMAEFGVPAELRVKNLLCWTVSNTTMEQTDLIDGLRRHFIEETHLDDKVYARQAQACIQHDALERLESIQSPTLVVCGEQDILTPVSQARELADGIPDSHLVPIPEAGHLVVAELAPRVNRLISRFVSGQFS